MQHGGVLYDILWALSIIKLNESVLEARHRLENDFDKKIQAEPDNTELPAKKAQCLKQFDKSNRDTTAHVERAREIFARYPEFSGLILTDIAGK